MAFECLGIQLLTLNFCIEGVSEDHTIVCRVTEENSGGPKVNYTVPGYPWLLDFDANNKSKQLADKVDSFIDELIYYYYRTVDFMEASDQYNVTFIQYYLTQLHPTPPISYLS